MKLVRLINCSLQFALALALNCSVAQLSVALFLYQTLVLHTVNYKCSNYLVYIKMSP